MLWTAPYRFPQRRLSMSDKPESESRPSEQPGVRKKAQSPSFDDILANAGKKEEPAAPAPRKSEPPPVKKATQPSFEDILASAAPAAAGAEGEKPRDERRPRPPRREKE